VERFPVSSSNIVSVGYDADSQTLEIEFSGGATYQYFQVPPNIYEEFMHASSKGKYHHQAIKSRFRSSRV
jgi:hypothetical protein